MGKVILVNSIPEETRMAIVEDGELLEVAAERENEHIVGNIYKGKIKNVLPGMQAAFIDIGLNKNAYLYIGDSNELGGAEGEVLTVGQSILVQVVKDSIGTKGPRATTHITLPGRYAVLMPTVNYIGISRKISDEQERERLKGIAEQVRPSGMGLIIRTVAEGKNAEELKRDIVYLTRLWNSLLARAKIAQGAMLLYRDVDLVIRIVRDYLSDDVKKFVLDTPDNYRRITDLLSYILPEFVSRVELFEGQDIFTQYQVTPLLTKLRQRRVDLASGGYIVIDHTEALTAIDVNTGKYVGTTSLADTAFRMNCEAVCEIACQLRLRDIGGIIIIDFIDMDKPAHREKILALLAAELSKDRVKTNLVGFTGLGLVELTRKKSRQNLENIEYRECPVCGGVGKILSPETIAIRVKRRLRSIQKENNRFRNLLLQVHPIVAEVLGRQKELLEFEKDTGCKITIETIATLHPETFSILDKGSIDKA